MKFASLIQRWDTEVFILQGDSRQALIAEGDRLWRFLSARTQVELKDLASTLAGRIADDSIRLAIVASSLEDLKVKLERALLRLKDPELGQIKDRRGVYYFAQRLAREGKLAFLFPGEGSQFPNMLRDLCLHLPEVRASFDRMDRAFIRLGASDALPSRWIFPVPGASVEQAESKGLWRMDLAVASLTAANQAVLTLLRQLEIRPDALVGHSTGEYAGLQASGIMDLSDEASYQQYVADLREIHRQAADRRQIPQAALLAVGADSSTVCEILEGSVEDLHIGMENCPHQTVIVGSSASVDGLIERELKPRGLMYELLPFDRPYHTPLFGCYTEYLRSFFARWLTSAPRVPLYSCTSVAPYPQELREIRNLALRHWVEPVRFRQTIEAMYAHGIRIFLEVGPKGHLTAFVDDILGEQPHLAVAPNLALPSGITQLNHLVAQLAAHGVSMRLDYLYQGRAPRQVSFEVPSGPGKLKVEPVALALELPILRIKPRARPAPCPAAPSLETPPGDAAGASRELGAAAVEEYLNTMNRFLDLTGRVIHGYLSQREATAQSLPMPGEEISVPDTGRVQSSSGQGRFPFLQKIVSLDPGKELVAHCEVDTSQYPFLKDHTLGRDVSLSEPELKGLPIMPLTMSMEMMAQAAAALRGADLKVVGMKGVRAHRWMAFDRPQIVLQISARCLTSSEVQVVIQERPEPGTPAPLTPIVEGTVTLEETYPAPPLSRSLNLLGAESSRWPPHRLYEEAMFHGPAFRGVASMDRVGENGAEATLKVLPLGKLVAPSVSGSFVTDPVLLDQPGQVVGFWAAQRLEKAFLVFPFQFEALHLYGPLLTAGEEVKCVAQIALVGDQQVRSDLDIVLQNGRLWGTFVGWEDRRFHLPWDFYRLLLSPQQVVLSKPWLSSLPFAREFQDIEGYRLDSRSFPTDFFTAHHGIWASVLAYLILNRKEREHWHAGRMSERRRVEWLMGRLVAKDAVREYLRKRHGLSLCPADIEVGGAEGRPIASGSWMAEVTSVPAISISHSTGSAVAVVGDGGAGLGVDIEHISRMNKEVAQTAFTRDEEALLGSMDHDKSDGWPLRFWCAKEAAAKALASRLEVGWPSLKVRNFENGSGKVRLAIMESAAQQNEKGNYQDVTVYTARQGDWAVAVSRIKLRENHVNQKK